MLWHSTTNMNIAMWMHALLAAKMSLYRVKIRWSLVKYQVRRVTPEITRIEIDFFAQMGKNWVKIGISNGISQQVSEPSSRNFKLWWIYVCELIWHNFRVSPRDVAMVTNYYYFFWGGGHFAGVEIHHLHSLPWRSETEFNVALCMHALIAVQCLYIV